MLLPDEGSSDSLAASDLDFSNLSLDSSMDQLSRMADSLAQGMPPGSMSLNAAALPAGTATLPHAVSDGRSQRKASLSGNRHRHSPSSHACPTCHDLVSEETQSQAESSLSQLSQSEADSLSESELLSLGLQPLDDVPSPISSNPRGAAHVSGRALAKLGAGLRIPSSRHQRAQPHHDPQTDGHRAAAAFPGTYNKQELASAEQSLHMPVQDRDVTDRPSYGLPAEDSSCFGSQPASVIASPRRQTAAVLGTSTAPDGDSSDPAQNALASDLRQVSNSAAVHDSSMDGEGSHGLHEARASSSSAPSPRPASAAPSRYSQAPIRNPAASLVFKPPSAAGSGPPEDVAQDPSATRPMSASHGRRAGAGQAPNKPVQRHYTPAGAASAQHASQAQPPSQLSDAAAAAADPLQGRLNMNAEVAVDAPQHQQSEAAYSGASDGCEHAIGQPIGQPIGQQLGAAVQASHTAAGSAAAEHLQPALEGPDEDQDLASELSESEEEFERTLAHARRLRPSNQPQIHARCATIATLLAVACWQLLWLLRTPDSASHHANQADGLLHVIAGAAVHG